MEQNNTLKHLSNFNEMLYQRLQDVEHRLERLKIICTSLGGNDFSELIAKINSIQSELDIIKQNISSNSTIITNMQSIVDNHENSINSLTYDLTNVVEQNAGLHNKLNEHNKSIESLNTTTNTHTTQIADHEAKFLSLENSGLDYESIGSIQQQVSSLEQTTQNHSTKITNLQTSNTDLTSRMNILENNTLDLPKIRDDIVDNFISITNLNTSFTNYKKEAEKNLNNSVNTLNEEISTINQTNAEQDETIQQIETDIINNQSITQTHQEKINDIYSQLNNLKCDNELTFILNGTYIPDSSIDLILKGIY